MRLCVNMMQCSEVVIVRVILFVLWEAVLEQQQQPRLSLVSCCQYRLLHRLTDSAVVCVVTPATMDWLRQGDIEWVLYSGLTFFCFVLLLSLICCWFRCVGTELVACTAASVIPVNRFVDLIRFRCCLGCGQIIGSMLSQYQGLSFLIVSSCKGFQASSTCCPYGCC